MLFQVHNIGFKKSYYFYNLMIFLYLKMKICSLCKMLLQVKMYLSELKISFILKYLHFPVPFELYWIWSHPDQIYHLIILSEWSFIPWIKLGFLFYFRDREQCSGEGRNIYIRYLLFNKMLFNDTTEYSKHWWYKSTMKAKIAFSQSS